MGEMKQKIKVLELEPSGGGAFEVHVDGKEVYSKLKTGKFPDEARARRGDHRARVARKDTVGFPPTQSREILHRNPFAVGDPRHRAAGDAVLEALLVGTDAEGFSGDRGLLQRAVSILSLPGHGGTPTVGETYRLRSADRVEALFFHAEDNPRSIAGLPGRFEVGLVHAVEVTRADDLAFRTSPCWRRAGGRGWILVDGGDGSPVARAAGREALHAAQEASILHGLALAQEGLATIAAAGPAPVEVALALRATSLPRSVRDRAGARLAASATLADVVVALADVAAGADREEGESYARAAGRLVRNATRIAAAAGVDRPGAVA